MKLVTTTADLAEYYDNKSVAAPVEGIAQTGFRHIDLSMYHIIYRDSPWIASGDGWKKEIEDAEKAARMCKVDFCQAHSPDGEHFRPGEARDALILATKRSIEACAMLNIPCTVIHASAVKGESKEKFITENIDFFRLFEEEATRFGVQLLVENTAAAWNPEYYLWTGKDMADFVKTAGLDYLHICWDIGHGNVQGCNQYDDIMAMGKELKAIHLQDNYGDCDTHVMPMSGTTNFDKVIRGLIDSGYEGCFTFEGSNTIRRGHSWPRNRRDITPDDRLTNVPLAIQQKQISVMYEIGKWMLEQYGIPVE